MADTWIPVMPRSEGIEILPDGTILLNALRAQGLTYIATYNTDEGSEFGHLKDLVPRKFRLTAAIPLDHTIKFGYKLSGATGNLPTAPAGATLDDFDSTSYPRQHYAKAPKYERWMRKDAFPIPESIYDPKTQAPHAKFPDKTGALGANAEALRDDLPQLQNEAKRNLAEVGRIQGRRSIFLKGLCFDFAPGDEIKDIDGARVGKVVQEVILHCGNETQQTELVMG